MEDTLHFCISPARMGAANAAEAYQGDIIGKCFYGSLKFKLLHLNFPFLN
jgi:hypothetical protein